MGDGPIVMLFGWTHDAPLVCIAMLDLSSICGRRQNLLPSGGTVSASAQILHKISWKNMSPLLVRTKTGVPGNAFSSCGMPGLDKWSGKTAQPIPISRECRLPASLCLSLDLVPHVLHVPAGNRQTRHRPRQVQLNHGPDPQAANGRRLFKDRNVAVLVGDVD